MGNLTLVCEKRLREIIEENKRLRSALNDIMHLSYCQCSDSWLDRGMHDPTCGIDIWRIATDALKGGE